MSNVDIIDRKKVKEAFARYVSAYDTSDPKIALKIKHTYKVSELCEEIAASEGLKVEDVNLAWLIGMLHDIGRFEQCRIYDTFNDSESVDHAKFGCELLFGKSRIISDYIKFDKYNDLIHDAIYYHSVYRIPEDLDKRAALFTNILRDADKLDIIRANNETPLEEIYNSTKEEVLSCDITDAVLQGFYEHHAILRSIKRTPVDNLVGHISLMFELVFNKSRELALSLGYLEEMLQFKSNNPKTNQKMAEIREEIMDYLKNSCHN